MSVVSTIKSAAAPSDWRSLPLNVLFLGEGNVRKVRRKKEGDGLTGMQSSILNVDILQNLVVVERSTGFEVFAGGERLRNLQGLAELGKIPADHPVMCRVVPEEIALNASLTENVMRTAMHPADEFIAFRDLLSAGNTVEEIATNYGVTPAVVTRRMKLANLSPKLIEEFRAGHANIDQMMALTLAHDHVRQEAIYFGMPEGQRHSHLLRREATVGEVNIAQDALGRFVGLEAYEAAGGAVRADLFTEAAYITDMGLLTKLSSEKLASIAAEVEAEGWSWVEVMPRLSYDAYYNLNRVEKTSRMLTEDEAAQIERLQAEIDRLDGEINQATEQDDEDTADQLEEQRTAIEEQIEEITDGLRYYSDEDKAIAGVMLGVEGTGRLRIERGLLKKGVRRNGAEGAGGSTEPEAPTLSARMGRQLTAHQTAALQVELARNPNVAMAVSLHATVLTTLKGKFCDPLKMPVGVTMSRYTNLADEAPDYANSPAQQALQVMCDKWSKRLPDDSGKLLTALLKLKAEELMELFALCAALHVDVVRDKATNGKSSTDELSRLLKLDMRTYWQPTADGYFKHVKKGLALEAVQEYAPDQVGRLSTLKKADLAAEAERLAVGTGWLPPILKTHE